MPDARQDRACCCDASESWENQHALADDADRGRSLATWGWPMVVVTLLVVVPQYFLLTAGPAYAEYHGQKVSPEIHEWFARLKIPPIYAEGCCGYHRDCWETQAYYKEGRWWALYRPFAADPTRFDDDARFIPIPAGSVESAGHLYQHYNLTQRPVLCALPDMPTQFGKPSVYCFVPPPTSF